MSEEAGNGLQTKRVDLNSAQELQQSMEAVWNQEAAWENGTEISFQENILPIGTQAIKQINGRIVLRAIMLGGPRDEVDKKKPRYVPIAIFDKDETGEKVTKIAEKFFKHTVRGEVKFTGKVPSKNG